MIINGFIERPRFYSLIENKMKDLGIGEDDYPVDSIKIASLFKDNLHIEFLDFQSPSIGGVMYKGIHKSSMALNNLRTKKGMNFDCMHELIHYWFHPTGTNLCFDTGFTKQNNTREWQANEGAAEILMPKKLFKRMYMDYRGSVKGLSDYFLVGEKAVTYRVSNLGLDKINFKLLRTCGRKKNIHCAICGNIDFSYRDYYCKICGEPIFVIKDTRWVKYGEGVELDEFGHAIECPVCGSRDIIPFENTCRSCGASLFQKCTDNGNDDIPADEKSCGRVLDGSARYCKRCGHKSTFYRDKYLKDWQEEMAEILNIKNLRITHRLK